jgi:glycerol-3-phosphate dehydrogenase (NAD(P)+)
MSTPIGILGAGAWGTALAVAVSRAGHRVVLWGRDASAIAALRATRENAALLPGVTLPESVAPVSEIAAAALPVVIAAVPTQALAGVLAALAPAAPDGLALIAAAKGIEQGSGRFVSEIVQAALPNARPAILSGPSFAADVGRGLPTAVTLAANDSAFAERLATLIGSPGFRIYHSADMRGVEIGGAAKNVLAIAAGIVAGAGLGESARAATVTRGFAEMRRFAAAYGARPETLMGLSGLGDLMLSAASAQSRNFAFGLALGRGEPLAEAGHGKLAEGAFTAPVLVAKAAALGVEMPLSATVAAILDGRMQVREAVAALTERPQRAET